MHLCVQDQAVHTGANCRQSYIFVCLDFVSLQVNRKSGLHLRFNPLALVPGQVDFGDCQAYEAGCYPLEGARPVSTIMTRYLTRALKQWRTRQEQAELLHKQQHKAAHPGLQGSLQRRKKALMAKLSRPVRQVQLHVDHDNQALKIV